jgi:hypothetical protein
MWNINIPLTISGMGVPRMGYGVAYPPTVRVSGGPSVSPLYIYVKIVLKGGVIPFATSGKFFPKLDPLFIFAVEF